MGEMSLDPYHTHFLLIDSGNPEKEYKKELTGGKIMINQKRQNIYREEIEARLVEHYKVPIIR